jgi:hypothetical protein
MEQPQIEEEEKPFSPIFDHPVVQSIKLNYIFYITLIACVCAIAYCSRTSYFWAIITIIFISVAGYFSHYISHRINAGELFTKFNKKHSIIENEYIKTGVEMFCKLIDFHDVTHHDTDINKQWGNLAMEFAMNFYVQAGAFLLLFYGIQQMNLYVITLWGLMYSTIHNINYLLYPSQTHMLHHADKKTNYGIDIWDILFRTKYEGDYSYPQLENINHYAINTLLITLVMIVIMHIKVSIKIGF